MNQLRHNFTKIDRLSAQIIAYIEQFSAQYRTLGQDDSISCQIENVEINDWQSATYDGEKHHYLIKIYWSEENPIINSNDYKTKLASGLNDYEFILSKSFVADINISQLQIMDRNIWKLNIETLIIHEE